jgi:hypothetical protein
MKTPALLLILSLASCGTSFYDAQSGKPIARFQGDMQSLSFTRAADGAITWTAASVNHSAATLAAGTATAGAVTATGTAAAIAGATALLK